MLKSLPLDHVPVIEYMKSFRNLANAGDQGRGVDFLSGPQP